MKDIFEKDFIIKVLAPMAGAMLFAGIFYLLSPFILLLGFLVFAGLFFFTKYTKDLLEEEIYYEEEDTSPIEDIRKQININAKPNDYYSDFDLDEPSSISNNKPVGVNDVGSMLEIEDEKGEALHFEKANSLTQQIRASVDEDYPEPVRAPKKKSINMVSKSMNSIKRRREVPVKKEINYDEDFEFEYGSYDD